MKRTVCVFLVVLLAFPFGLSSRAAEAEQMYLAKAIASVMGKEPFVVKVAFGEVLLNRLADPRFPDTLPAVMQSLGKRANAAPTEEDLRAASVVLCNYGFSGGALYVEKWRKRKNTPSAERRGARLYTWYFYASSQSAM